MWKVSTPEAPSIKVNILPKPDHSAPFQPSPKLSYKRKVHITPGAKFTQRLSGAPPGRDVPSAQVKFQLISKAWLPEVTSMAEGAPAISSKMSSWLPEESSKPSSGIGGEAKGVGSGSILLSRRDAGAGAGGLHSRDKSLPLMVISVPPAVVPLLGSTELIVGVSALSKVSTCSSSARSTCALPTKRSSLIAKSGSSPSGSEESPMTRRQRLPTWPLSSIVSTEAPSVIDATDHWSVPSRPINTMRARAASR